MKTYTRFLLPVLFVMTACHPRSQENQVATQKMAVDSLAGFAVADTIIYDVVIRNPDSDDVWKTKCLQRLHREALIDSLFSMVYNGQAVAYNHITNEQLTPAEVHKAEKMPGFSRGNIGMIQFTEAWYLNPGSHSMTKKVISMVLGYNYYEDNGNLIGYKPLFRMELQKKGIVPPRW